MWNSILETLCKGLANDDPALIEQILQANTDFQKWVKYYNPNDIASIKEGEKIMVGILSEDLQDLKMRGDYFHYLTKKTNDQKLTAIWNFIYQTCNAHFWIGVRTKYKLWEYTNIAMRDGFKIVAIPCDAHEVPDIIKRMLGLE